MTVDARELLQKFESLNPADRQEVAAEILRRTAGRDGLSDEAYQELGAALLHTYDDEAVETAVTTWLGLGK